MADTRSLEAVIDDLKITQQHRDRLVTENEALKREAAAGNKALAKAVVKEAAVAEVHDQLSRALAELDVAKKQNQALVAAIHRLEGQLAKSQRTEQLIREGVLEVKAVVQ